MRHFVIWLTTTVLAVALLGCGGSDNSSTPAASAPPVANRAPTLARPNADRAAAVGVEFSYDATQSGLTFSDLDRDVLAYTVQLNGESTHGLTVDGNTIIGTPTDVGTVEVSITATDPDGATATDTFAINIGTAPEIARANENQSTRIGAPFSYDASQAGETFVDLDGDTLTYTIRFSPDGQALSAAGPIISGTPAITGLITATITAADDDGHTSEDSFDITVLPREPSQIFVTQTPGFINVFVKGSTETSQKYLRYQFRQFDKPVQMASGWGWRYVHEATLQPNETFLIGDRLLNGGENFVGIREVGKTDFMGGPNHGNQIDSAFVILVDGEEKLIDGISRYIGEDIQFKQVSTLSEVDNPILTPVAIVNTDFSLSFGGNTLRNRLEFIRPTELTTALMIMLSAERHLNGNDNDTLLSSTGEWGPDFIPLDISEFGHEAPRTPANELRLYGPSGYRFEVEVTAGWDEAISRSEINDGSRNNKLYFSPIGFYPSIGPGLNVPAGHVIEIEAEYRLDTTN